MTSWQNWIEQNQDGLIDRLAEAVAIPSVRLAFPAQKPMQSFLISRSFVLGLW